MIIMYLRIFSLAFDSKMTAAFYSNHNKKIILFSSHVFASLAYNLRIYSIYLMLEL